MPTIITRGAGSAQGLGYASSSAAVTYIEDVFSTYLYTGNGSTQTITTGVDTGTKGGLIWVKKRSAADDHALFDSVRASGSILSSNLSDAATAGGTRLALTSTGFDLQAGGGSYNQNGFTYASWTFRKQPKFFDIVTYTGTGSNATISHNLGSEPGCIIVKRTDAVASWYVYHRGLSGIGNKYIILNSTAAEDTGFFWTPTSTTFNVSSTLGLTANGGTYVAYLFAHDAGGFGLTGTDNVISCGSVTTDGSGNATVNLGYEPQWLLSKWTTTADNWHIYDDMRGWSVNVNGTSSNANDLYPNSSDAETNRTNNEWYKTSTGFAIRGSGASRTYIYIAIRRGPMKVPTSGTSVFAPATRTGTGAAATITSAGFPPDLLFNVDRTASITGARFVFDRLRGTGITDLRTNNTSIEGSSSVSGVTSYGMTGFSVSSDISFNDSGVAYINWFFRRAPGFFDEVCYTGTNVARTVTHNLAAVPELMIIKSRNGAYNWTVKRNASLEYAVLNSTQAFAGGFETALWNNTEPTSSVFSLGTNASVNGSATYIAYLFATVAGVSKVGSYTGTGTTQVINCGFTAGARFVLIKRTDSTGDWYVWDSARGIVAGNDPHLSLNTTAAEVTTDDSVDTDSTGFVVNQVAATNINVTSASYIFLAVS